MACLPRDPAQHQPAPDEQHTELVSVTASVPVTEARSERREFTITSLQILQMARACLSAQTIQDALEGEGPIHPDEVKRLSPRER